MTLLLTEIHCLDGLSDSLVIFAADRRISRNGKYDGTRKKIFPIAHLQAGIGYFGLAEVQTKSNIVPMSDWLSHFIKRNTHLTTLKSFAEELKINLNRDIRPQLKEKYVSGFHLAGHNSSDIPEFWYIRNVRDDNVTFTGSYEVREDFLDRDAKLLGYDGRNLNSVQSGAVQTYRNGDIRAHITAWEKIDDAFRFLLREKEFKEPKTSLDYEQWVKFKMEIIAYFYKKYCQKSLIARPIDVFCLQKKLKSRI